PMRSGYTAVTKAVGPRICDAAYKSRPMTNRYYYRHWRPHLSALGWHSPRRISQLTRIRSHPRSVPQTISAGDGSAGTWLPPPLKTLTEITVVPGWHNMVTAMIGLKNTLRCATNSGKVPGTTTHC